MSYRSKDTANRPSPNHRWVTTRSEYEWDGHRYVETVCEGYWYEGPWALAHDVTAVYVAEDYRWRNDDGSITAATWVSSENSAVTAGFSPGDNVRLRVNFGETAGASGAGQDTGSWTLQFSKNGGTWTTVGAATDVKYFDSTGLTNGTAIAIANHVLAWSGAGTMQPWGDENEDGVTPSQTWSKDYAEAEFSLQFDAANTAPNDTFTFRLLNPGGGVTTFTNVPTISLSISTIITDASFGSFTEGNAFNTYGKPHQRKVWWNGAQSRWDGLIPTGLADSDHFIFADIKATTSDTRLELEDRSSGRVDTYWDEAADKLYAIGSHATAPEFWRVDYTSGTDTYAFGVGSTGLGVALGSNDFDVDTPTEEDYPLAIFKSVLEDDRIWVGVLNAAGLFVGWSDDDGATWGSLDQVELVTAPNRRGIVSFFEFATGGNNYIGVCAVEDAGTATDDAEAYCFTIDQATTSVNLRTAGNWTDESSNVANSTLTPTGLEHDNHLCVMTDPNHKMFWVSKTSNGSGGDPLFVMYERTAAGTWTGPTEVMDHTNTPSRPSICYDSTNNEIYLFYTLQGPADERGVYKKASSVSGLSAASEITIYEQSGKDFSNLFAPRENVTPTTNLMTICGNFTDETVYYYEIEITQGNNLSAVISTALSASPSLSAVGQVAASLSTTSSIVGPLSAAGTVAAAVSTALSVAANLNAKGELQAAKSIILSIAATLSAKGEMAAALTLLLTASPDLDATGTIASALSSVLTVSADVTELTNNEVAANLITALTVAADVNAVGTLDVVAGTAASLIGTLNAQGTLDASLATACSIAASLTAIGRLDAAAQIVASVVADASARGELQSAVTALATMAAGLTAIGELQATAQIFLTVAASVDDANANALAAALQIALAVTADVENGAVVSLPQGLHGIEYIAAVHRAARLGGLLE